MRSTTENTGIISETDGIHIGGNNDAAKAIGSFSDGQPTAWGIHAQAIADIGAAISIDGGHTGPAAIGGNAQVAQVQDDPASQAYPTALAPMAV